MANLRMYVYKHGMMTTTAIEGDGRPLNEAVRQYPKKQKLRGYVDFSPIFHEKDNRLFLVGNFYYPEVCTMVTDQYLDGRKNATSITAHGTNEALAINMIKDFARVLDFRSVEPSEQLKREARLTHAPFETLCDTARLENTDPRLLFATALGIRQQAYRREKASYN